MFYPWELPKYQKASYKYTKISKMTPLELQK